MKRLLFTQILIFLLVFISCKTKSIDQSKGNEIEYNVVEVDCLKHHLNRHSTTHIENQLTQEELVQALSQLNINYNGDNIEDKLDVLLSKTREGTKISFQGKGTAGYSENTNTEISTLRNDIINHTDSLINQIIVEQQRNFEQSESEWNKRVKEVDTITFTPAVWLIVALALILGIFLSWISKKIKPLIKWP